MKINYFKISAILYIVAAINTFGHAYNNTNRYMWNSYTEKNIRKDESLIVLESLLKTMGWPLYVSTIIWENNENKNR